MEPGYIRVIDDLVIRYQPQLQLDKHRWSFSCYLHLLIINLASVAGRRFSNIPTSQVLFVN
jgi:hypothetical protein